MAAGDEVASVNAGSKLGWVMLSITRIAIGFVFLWAFFDKLIGLGLSTCRDAKTGAVTVMCDGAWLKGGPVTEGYLVYGGNPSSPFHDFFVRLGAERWADWPFMIGLLSVGLALTLGIGTKLGACAGSVMLLFMYLTQLWPSNNPIIDEHVIYILTTFAIVWLELGRQSIGLGKWWRSLPLVQSNSWLI